MLFCDFIARWPTLSAVRHAHLKILEAFFHSHNCRRPRLTETRLESIRCANSLTDDPGVVSPCRLHALTLAAQLRTVLSVTPVRLLAGLVELYVSLELCEALMLAFAAENEARVRAGLAARTNVQEPLASLSQQHRAMRQDEITAEIVELTTGREAARRAMN
ncbi:F0F1 ATP synthase subunit gamma [Paraburkholderia sp. BR10879]|uniref:F0F1 ATP synthase subunit gamma n=1 Tax=Paraburkholderia sp. BR10879 TaxID=3236990 RepID=UPI003979850A